MELTMIKFLDALTKELTETQQTLNHKRAEIYRIDMENNVGVNSQTFWETEKLGNQLIDAQELDKELKANLKALNDTLTSIDHYLFELNTYPERWENDNG